MKIQKCHCAKTNIRRTITGSRLKSTSVQESSQQLFLRGEQHNQTTVKVGKNTYEVVRNMIKEIVKFVQDNYKLIGTILGVITPSLFTLIIDRHKRSNEQQLKIQEEQFNKVYFPLYLLVEQYLQDPINKKDLKDFLKASKQIKSQNIPLVHQMVTISLNELSSISQKSHMDNKAIMRHKKIKWLSLLNSTDMARLR